MRSCSLPSYIHLSTTIFPASPSMTSPITDLVSTPRAARPARSPSSLSGGTAMSSPPEVCASASISLSSSVIPAARSEEHTSELQSRLHLVCRLLLEKKTKHKDADGDIDRLAGNIVAFPSLHDN